jgi:hypothetical protein
VYGTEYLHVLQLESVAVGCSAYVYDGRYSLFRQDDKIRGERLPSDQRRCGRLADVANHWVSSQWCTHWGR